VTATVHTDEAIFVDQGVSDEFSSLYRASVFAAEELDGVRKNGLLAL
jgi:hypothetical protein